MNKKFYPMNPVYTIENQEALYMQMFSAESLVELFENVFSDSKLRGYDGLSAEHIAKEQAQIFATAANKCDAGKYRFTPYKEKLISKGRKSPPRMVSIPGVRDRVVLKQLQRFLFAIYPETDKQTRPKDVILPVIDQVKNQYDADLWVYGGDVQKFYDSIPHDQLLAVLEQRITVKPILQLIQHAIVTPTLPQNTPRKYYGRYRHTVGVPQGLSIAGILAAIYMLPIDEAIQGKHPDVFYTRYVDDILMIGQQTAVSQAEMTLKSFMNKAQLSLHTSKTKQSFNRITAPFQFLGYQFQLPNKITVRESTVNRLKKRLLHLFAEEKKTPYEHFMAKLNVRITGFIETEQFQYLGWMAYFKEMTDLTLLYELDSFVQKQFSFLPHFKHKAPKNLKSYVRSYHEANHSHKSGYIPQFSRKEVPKEWLAEIIDEYVQIRI